MAAITRLSAYARLIRLEKPVGWLLLLWPTLWALWLAEAGHPSWNDIALFTAGVFTMRCFGCCVNDLADRKLDAQVSRTQVRPLAAGTISVTEALLISALMLAAAFALWLQLEPVARWWALGALPVAASYPFAKYFIKLPQLHLGVAFSLGIPVAFAHASGSVPASAIVLVAANFCWIFAYDTIYAMVDREDDRAAGIGSSALWLGERDVQGVGLAYFFMLMLLLTHALIIGAGFGYYLAVGLGFAMALRFCRRIRSRDRGDCFRTFNENHWLGALILLGLIADSRAIAIP